jgi:membrane protease YdiL (CAAX protease family)
LIWVFVALLVGWGNAGSSLLGGTAQLPGGSVAFALMGVTLVALSVAISRRAGLDLAAMGLRSTAWPRGALMGVASGAAIALAGIAGMQLASLIIGAPVVYDPLRDVTQADLVRHILFFLPLGTVLPEEVAFRGTLVGLLRRGGVRAALLGSAAAFALWHAAVAVVTVGETTVAAPSPWFLPAIAGALAVVFMGGVVLAWLRLWTGTLATTIAAHWAFNATLLFGLWATLPTPTPQA